MATISIRVRLRTRRAERELRSSLPFARSAHPRGAYFLKTCFQKVKKTTEAVFLEKVFLMGYLIKLQNVLGRLRDYNNSSSLFRKYQGFTKLTNSQLRFCTFLTKRSPFHRPATFFQYIFILQLQTTPQIPRVQSFLFPIKVVRSSRESLYFQEALLLPCHNSRLRCVLLLYRFRL